MTQPWQQSGPFQVCPRRRQTLKAAPPSLADGTISCLRLGQVDADQSQRAFWSRHRISEAGSCCRVYCHIWNVAGLKRLSLFSGHTPLLQKVTGPLSDAWAQLAMQTLLLSGRQCVDLVQAATPASHARAEPPTPAFPKPPFLTLGLREPQGKAELNPHLCLILTPASSVMCQPWPSRALVLGGQPSSPVAFLLELWLFLHSLLENSSKYKVAFFPGPGQREPSLGELWR